jgi:hypothetical protein
LSLAKNRIFTDLLEGLSDWDERWTGAAELAGYNWEHLSDLAALRLLDRGQALQAVSARASFVVFSNRSSNRLFREYQNTWQRSSKPFARKAKSPVLSKLATDGQQNTSTGQ